jgi:putative endonuclease
MVIIYVLKSEINGTHYVGMTENLDRRIGEHNQGKSKFTSANRPWKLIFSEKANDFKAGRIKEKYFKSAAGKKYIQKRLSEGSLPD